MPLTNVDIDLIQTAPKASSTGCTHTGHEGLKGEAFVKFHGAFAEKVIKTLLSSNLQVSSHKALEMDNKDNFFHVILDLMHASLQMEA